MILYTNIIATYVIPVYVLIHKNNINYEAKLFFLE